VGGQGGAGALGGAGGQSGAGGKGGGTASTTTVALTIDKTNTAIDILFVLNNWSSTSEIQQKLSVQLPQFVAILKSATVPLDLHIAVTTADMGAPSDVASSVGCTAEGDGGAFRTGAITGTCTNGAPEAGATYLTDDGKGTTNFNGTLAGALQCIAGVGNTGCGFGQPLAAAVRSLGADDLLSGTPNPPATNVGFLRPDAYLAIILLVDRDDCSPPTNTELFSVQGQPDNLTNPLGPLNYYRCNRYGHLCNDSRSASPTALISPPLQPPGDAQGTASQPTLDLQNCQDNDTATGLLTPVQVFVDQIKALKADPANEIMVAAFTAPATPYSVVWMPAAGGQSTSPGELWPQVELSCGPQGGVTNPESTDFTTDGSSGEPGVRVSQFANAFPDSYLTSICYASYAVAMHTTAVKIAELPSGQNCVTGTIQSTAAGIPTCTVTAQVLDAATNTITSVAYPNCGTNGNTPPCWTLNVGTGSCTGQSFLLMDAPGTTSQSATATCSICNPGAVVLAPGC